MAARRNVLGVGFGSILILLAIAGWSSALAQTSQLISEVRIVGNQRVESDAIRIHISSRAGEPINDATVDQDVKAIYKMGLIENVDAERTDTANGVILTFRVKERPYITEVRYDGMKNLSSKDDAVRTAMRLREHAILDPLLVEETTELLKKVYEDKGYLDVAISFRTISHPDNTAVAVFDVKEGPRVFITKVTFNGNKAFSSRTLGRIVQTSPRNLLSFLTGSGVVDHKKLAEDVDRITSYYYDRGYLNVRVSDPEVTRHDNSLTVTYNIDEGQPFKVGKVDITGDLKVAPKELSDLLTLKSGEIFRGSTMQHDVLTLSDFYSNRGYAYVNVDPHTQLDTARHQIDVTFNITPGKEVLVDRINISGNTKTSDKVIRREMQIQEQEPYSAEKIRISKARLDRLGIFEETRINTAPGREPDRINLDVGVKEGQTGSFQLAGGFDTASSAFGDFKISENNLFGGGQAISMDAQIGFLFQNYTLSYTEPYFLDMPLNVGFDLFDWKLYLFSFNQSSAGFAIRSSYPLVDLGLRQIGPLSLADVSAGLGYRFESVGVGGLSGLTTYEIRRYKGYRLVSKISPSIRRYTVDNPTDPRHGSVQSLNFDFAGPGGNVEFFKFLAHGRFFFSFIDSPIWGNWVYSIGGDYGIGNTLGGNKGSELPLYERFFPGGINSVRGYEFYSLGPRVVIHEPNGMPLAYEPTGGSKELLLNNEVVFPIVEALGLRGVVFLDAGNAYRLSQSIDLTALQAAAGGGVRWRSPFGPLRLELGFPINPRPNDLKTDFIFGAGGNL
ncbi:MAG: outer membrane protein assembly factor BamA [Candidatus Binataceae bacterium]